MTAHQLHRRRATTRSDDLARIALRAVAQMAVTLLVAFHAWLLWTHVVGGKALEPQTAGRWIIAALVLVGFRALQRRGLPVFWGQRAIVLWLLVVVIHCHAGWSGEPFALQAGIPESISLLAQLAAPAASVLGLLLLGVFALLLARWASASRFDEWPDRLAGLPASGYGFASFPRPPPQF